MRKRGEEDGRARTVNPKSAANVREPRKSGTDCRNQTRAKTKVTRMRRTCFVGDLGIGDFRIDHRSVEWHQQRDILFLAVPFLPFLSHPANTHLQPLGGAAPAGGAQDALPAPVRAAASSVLALQIPDRAEVEHDDEEPAGGEEDHAVEDDGGRGRPVLVPRALDEAVAVCVQWGWKGGW
jgi:hypothetical protein